MDKPRQKKRITLSADSADGPDQTAVDGTSSTGRPLSAHSSLQYIHRAEQLIDRFETETALPWRESLSEFSDWLNAAVYPNISQASRRQVRAALRYYYGRSRLNPDLIPVASETAPRLSRKAVNRRGNTSAARRKGIRQPDWIALMRVLAADTRIHGQIAGAMMVASRAFGARPSEWFDGSTRFLDRGRHVAVLQIANGKYREDENGESRRSFGPTRVLIAPMGDGGIQPNEIEAVQFVTAMLHGWMNDLQDQRGITRLEARDQIIRSLGRKVLGARRQARIKDKITLYSARHQFAADAKAAGLSREEVAALMGHRSIETAGEHYGRRSSGWRGNANKTVGFRVLPSLENVREVQSFNLTTEEILIGPKVPDVSKWAPDF
ncbi:MAG: hypothetical protein WCY71_02390 [Halothiobacillaceae bacterium]